MRVLAYVVIVACFFWLMSSATVNMLLPGRALSRSLNAVPKKDTFEHAEVLDLMKLSNYTLRQERPWIGTPAVLMLLGTILLETLNRRQRTLDSANGPSTTTTSL